MRDVLAVALIVGYEKMVLVRRLRDVRIMVRMCILCLVRLTLVKCLSFQQEICPFKVGC